jgi:hypothetical protein
MAAMSQLLDEWQDSDEAKWLLGMVLLCGASGSSDAKEWFKSSVLHFHLD